MARAYTFAEFHERLQSGRITPEELRDYLELDSEALDVGLRIRPGTLLDAPPPRYDVNDDVHAYQARQHARAARIAVKAGLPRVVAAGDSWFLMPTIIPVVPAGIAQWLQMSEAFAVWFVGRWGYTLERILNERQYPDSIKTHRPDWFIISAGGNDVQHALASGQALYPYDAARPLEQSLTPRGLAVLQKVGAGYRALLSDVRQFAAALPVICFGYDYPRPWVGNGRHIGKHLTAQGYPRDKQGPLCVIILDRLNAIIKEAVSAFANTVFLNCLHVTDNYTWFDDMHPSDDGFKTLEHKFANEMQRVVMLHPGKKRQRRQSGRVEAGRSGRRAQRR